MAVERGLRAVYGGVVFLAAFLLFVVEPMAAKQLLPMLGGSSAVWVTCLTFFQGVLLLGYGYAHWMARRGRMWLHVLLLLAAVGVLVLPRALELLLVSANVSMRVGWQVSTHPVEAIFAMLGTTIGLPFLLLGATSPLLQVWWARSSRGEVPYRLFGLSNAGSLLGLAAYPLVVEPRLTLAQQRMWWAVGFGLYAGAMAALSALAERRGARGQGAGVEETRGEEISGVGLEAQGGVGQGGLRLDDAQGGVGPASVEPAGGGVGVLATETRRTRWLWVLLPMGATMQLAAVTSHLSQDIAAIPLLWVLPLAAYLATFVLAFELPRLYRREVVGRLLVVLLASLGYALSKVDTRLPVGLAILFYLAELFVASWFCHAELYRLRPARAERSTVFYLLVAAGGVAGTFAIAVASPLIFRANYDLALAFLATAGLAAAVTWDDGLAQRALWLAASVGLVALTVALHVEFSRNALVRVRNFYGSLRVTEAGYDSEGLGQGGSAATGTGPVRVLMNGRIRHGMQMLDADRRRIPTTYYGSDSGVGVALEDCCEGRTKRVGVIGLGAGTLAAYGRAGDSFTFYEINPLVEPIARNLFTYLRDSPAAVKVVEGDGRTSLAAAPRQGFDVLAVDAFSGDAIPLHLLTREAMALYRGQMAAGGVIAFHVSNSYLELAPEIRLAAEAEGMQARVVESFAVPAEGAYRATWVLVATDPAFFARPAVAAVAMPIRERAGLRVWTDDYSSLLPVLRLGQ